MDRPVEWEEVQTTDLNHRSTSINRMYVLGGVEMHASTTST